MVHCELQVTGDKFHLIDNGSAAGTLVNGQKINEQDISPGDTIQIGETTLKLVPAGVQDMNTAVAAPRPEARGERGDGQPDRLDHQQLPDRVGPGQGDHGQRLQGPRYAGQPADRLQGARPRIRHQRGRIPAIHPRRQDGRRPQAREPRRRLRGGQVGLELLDRDGIRRRGDPHQGHPADRPGEHARLAIRLDRRRAGRQGPGSGPRAAHHPPQRHAREILVRKADNVAKLGDLILAKALDGIMARQVTRPGQILGNIAYMPPERTRDDIPIDTRADVYSLGATVYALLTGRPPVEGPPSVDTISKIRTAEPAKPKKYQLSIPDQFQDVVMKCLEKRPELRYQTPTELLQDLTRVAKFQGMTF